VGPTIGAMNSGVRERVLNDHLTIVDDGPLPVGGPGTLFEVVDKRVEGRGLAGATPRSADSSTSEQSRPSAATGCTGCSHPTSPATI
jgi:hypothetical protein